MHIRADAGYHTVEDVDAMVRMIGREASTLPVHQPFVIAADWRGCTIFTPPVAEAVVKMLTGVNGRIERSALLHRSDHATSVLQVMRVVREAAAPNRKLFTEPAALVDWVSQVVGDDEKHALRRAFEQ